MIWQNKFSKASWKTIWYESEKNYWKNYKVPRTKKIALMSKTMNLQALVIKKFKCFIKNNNVMAAGHVFYKMGKLFYLCCQDRPRIRENCLSKKQKPCYWKQTANETVFGLSKILRFYGCESRLVTLLEIYWKNKPIHVELLRCRYSMKWGLRLTANGRSDNRVRKKLDNLEVIIRETPLETDLYGVWRCTRF